MQWTPILLLTTLAAGACTPAGSLASPAAPAVTARDEASGLAFAQAHCATCHAVVASRVSPNPEAPAFDAIVKTPGLTAVTLKAYLRDSHNFPDIMSFDIDPEQIDALAAHMLTLRRSD